jgi:hypothetical protein
MKIFKMLHLNILDGAIVRDTCTFHGVKKGPPIARHMVCDDQPNQQLDLDRKNEDVGILEMITIIARVKRVDLVELITQVFHDIKTITIEILALQLRLLSRLKVLIGKQQNMIAHGIIGLEHPNIDPLFPSTPSDNTFIKHRKILEPHAKK